MPVIALKYRDIHRPAFPSSQDLYSDDDNDQKKQLNDAVILDVFSPNETQGLAFAKTITSAASVPNIAMANSETMDGPAIISSHSLLSKPVMSSSNILSAKTDCGDDDKPSTFVSDEEDLILSDVFSSGVNLLKTFIGAGIISLPLAMASFGLVAGVILMTLAGCASLVGIYFYVYCAATINDRQVTPHSLASITWPFLGYLLSVCVSLKSLGVGLTYLLLIGNIMSTLMKGFVADASSIWTSPRLWIGIFMAGIVGPLSFLRRMDHLKYSSTLGLISVGYLTGLSIYNFIVKGISPAAESAIKYFAPFSIRALSRFGIFVFAFTCHQNIFPIYNETKKNSLRELMILCTTCVSISLGIYVVFGTFSYLPYADVLVGGSMFTYYPRDQVPFQVARALFAFLLAFSYPLQVVPFRMASRSIFSRVGKGEKESRTAYLVSTIFIVSVTLGVAMFLPEISNVLSLVGSMTSSVICYIVPSLYYLGLTRKMPFWGTRRHWAVAMLVFGVCIFLICTSMSLANFFI